MKRYLTKTEKLELLKKFAKHLDELTGDKVTFSETIKNNAKKVKIIFTPEAFSKMTQLVMAHTTEIAWHYMVKRDGENFRIYDVLPYPQTVGPANVHVKMGRKFGDGQQADPNKFYNDWYIDLITNMPEGQEADLCGQAHSHVNMGTTPSSVDTKQQKEELENKQNGFYLFQIINKKMDINTMLYDIDAGILYERDDVEILIEENELIQKSKQMLVQPETKVTEIKKIEDDDWKDNWTGYHSYYNDYDKWDKQVSKDVRQYLITITCDDAYAEYVVEAKSAAEADVLFTRWADANMDEIYTVFEVTEKDNPEIIIEPAYEVFGETTEIDYEELKGYANEFSEKL